MIWLTIDLPIRTVSEMNAVEHWSKTRLRARAQQVEVFAEWRKQRRMEHCPLPCTVTLTRFGPQLLDDDNLRSAFKWIRDQIKDLLNSDDSPRNPIKWEYAQEVGAHGVRIEVTHAEVA